MGAIQQVMLSGVGGSAAIETWYVDPSASGSTQDGTTANPYLSLNAALAGKCNKTFTLPIQIRCRTSSSTPDTVRASTAALNQMVTSATNYLEIVAETGNRAGGSWDATKYHLYPAYSVQSGTAFEPDKNYIRVDGLQIGISSQTAIAEMVYWGGSFGRISNCLLKGANHASLQFRGLVTIQGITAWNLIIYNVGVNGRAVHVHNDCSFYSCTFIGSPDLCVYILDGTSIFKNCYAYSGGGFPAYFGEAGATLTLTTSAASDTSGTAGLDNIAYSTANFVNVTPGSEDFHLPSGSALDATGTDTSGDAAPLNFTTDMDGAARTGTWDVGPLIR